MNKGLGRHPAPDDRDKKFLMKAVLAAVDLSVLPPYRYWKSSGVLDQGATSTCVGHSWRHFLSDAPLLTKTGPSPFEIYDAAQKIDKWPGKDYDGTSVRAGVKVLASLGHIQEYRWACWSVEEVVAWILTRGQVVGTNWYRGMYTPDRYGFLHLVGPIDGGHAYELLGVNRLEEKIRIKNSWGTGWGQSRMAWISFENMQRLLEEHGEACSAIERKVA